MRKRNCPGRAVLQRMRCGPVPGSSGPARRSHPSAASAAAGPLEHQPQRKRDGSEGICRRVRRTLRRICHSLCIQRPGRRTEPPSVPFRHPLAGIPGAQRPHCGPVRVDGNCVHHVRHAPHPPEHRRAAPPPGRRRGWPSGSAAVQHTAHRPVQLL